MNLSRIYKVVVLPEDGVRGLDEHDALEVDRVAVPLFATVQHGYHGELDALGADPTSWSEPDWAVDLQEVWVLHYEHRHGDDLSVHATEALAWAAAAGMVETSLEREIVDAAELATVQAYIDAGQHRETVEAYRGFVDREDLTIVKLPILLA